MLNFLQEKPFYRNDPPCLISVLLPCRVPFGSCGCRDARKNRRQAQRTESYRQGEFIITCCTMRRVTFLRILLGLLRCENRRRKSRSYRDWSVWKDRSENGRKLRWTVKEAGRSTSTVYVYSKRVILLFRKATKEASFIASSKILWFRVATLPKEMEQEVS